MAFSGWTDGSDGVQLIELSPITVTAAAAAHPAAGSRGVVLGSRLVSLSDESFGVIDYTDEGCHRQLDERNLAWHVGDEAGGLCARPRSGRPASVLTR